MTTPKECSCKVTITIRQNPFIQNLPCTHRKDLEENLYYHYFPHRILKCLLTLYTLAEVVPSRAANQKQNQNRPVKPPHHLSGQ